MAHAVAPGSPRRWHGVLDRGLRRRLRATGHSVTIIGRGPSATHDGWDQLHWDAETLGDRGTALDGANVGVHLAGKRVNCRPIDQGRRRPDIPAAGNARPIRIGRTRRRRPCTTSLPYTRHRFHVTTIDQAVTLAAGERS